MICRMLSRRKRVNFVYIWRITQFLKRVFSFVELFYEVYWVFSFVELFHEDLCWKSRFPNFVDLNLKILELKQFFDVFVQNWLFWLRKTGFLVVSQQFLRMTVCFFYVDIEKNLEISFVFGWIPAKFAIITVLCGFDSKIVTNFGWFQMKNVVLTIFPLF